MSKQENETGVMGWLSNEGILLIVAGIVGYAVSLAFSLNEELKAIVTGSTILLASLIITYVRRGVKYISDDVGKSYIRERTGIVAIYKNLNECKEDMRTDFEKAHRVRLLLQIGRREFGDGESSIFWDLARQKTEGGTLIQILRASAESPFLSKQRAKFRKTPVERWHEDLRRLTRQIALLKDTYECSIEYTVK